MKKILTVEGMSCHHCVMAVKNALKGLEGVKSVDVSLEEKKVEVEIGGNIGDNKIKGAIEEAGYTVVEIK
ncbi:copper ion binding protein [Thermohalobacter berrensis]|uniref:Heavy metal transport/detoxification protein n=1 Tax=Thermohalobacter berrensis TaxID=99594 RepID=A0A419T1M5_9FIRM|nr:copper ion binding protein [Thermohalobacter berrensis]RKD31328.1 heavy metal transport/detoxification protein [Thermohalobacter berrensis]